MPKRDYNNYINSPEWKTVREDAFLLHGRFCAKCGSKNRLHVHHKTYKRFTHERVDIDLIPLCESCHDKCHTFCKANNIDLWHGTERFIFGERRKKKHKSGLSKRQRRRLKREQNRYRKYSQFVQQRSPSMSVTEQLRRMSSSAKVVWEYEQNKKIRETKAGGLKVDVEKFAAQYGMTIERAKEVIDSMTR